MAAVCKSLAKTSTAKTPATTNVVRKITKRSRKTLKDMLQGPGADSRPLVHSDFDDRLSCKLPFGCTELLMAIDSKRYLRTLRCRQLNCVQELDTDEKCELVASFQHVFLNQTFAPCKSFPVKSISAISGRQVVSLRYCTHSE